METEANRDKLIADVKTLVADADDLVKAMASATGEKAAEMGERLRVKLRSAKEKLSGGGTPSGRAASANQTDKWVGITGGSRGCRRA